MDILNVLIEQLKTNHMLQGAVLSVVISQARNIFKTLDAAAKDPKHVAIVQALLVILSTVVSVGSAYLTGNLSTIPVDALVQSVIVAGTTILTALGMHQAGKDIKAKLEK